MKSLNVAEIAHLLEVELGTSNVFYFNHTIVYYVSCSKFYVFDGLSVIHMIDGTCDCFLRHNIVENGRCIMGSVDWLSVPKFIRLQACRRLGL